MPTDDATESPDMSDVPTPGEVVAQVRAEQRIDADAAMLAHARQRHGTFGAVLAGGMLGLDKAIGRPVKEDAPVVWEADGEPTDIDRNGITVPVDDTHDVHSAPTAATVRRVVKRRR